MNFAGGMIIGPGSLAQRHPVGVAGEVERGVEPAALLEKRTARDHVDGAANGIGGHPRHGRFVDFDALDIVDRDLIEFERAPGGRAVGRRSLIAVEQDQVEVRLHAADHQATRLDPGVVHLDPGHQLQELAGIGIRNNAKSIGRNHGALRLRVLLLLYGVGVTLAFARDAKFGKLHDIALQRDHHRGRTVGCDGNGRGRILEPRVAHLQLLRAGRHSDETKGAIGRGERGEVGADYVDGRAFQHLLRGLIHHRTHDHTCAGRLSKADNGQQ